MPTELKPCPFCGRKMEFYREEYPNRNGCKVVEQYYMHEDKEAECILDEICMPLVIGAGDASDGYIGEYPELWNRRAEMAEYIERKKAVNAVRNVYLGVQAINRIKAADVEPVRHGRWDKNGRCTVCGGHAPFWCMASTYYKSPYCSECGAKMDLEDDDND